MLINNHNHQQNCLHFSVQCLVCLIKKPPHIFGSSSVFYFPWNRMITGIIIFNSCKDGMLDDRYDELLKVPN